MYNNKNGAPEAGGVILDYTTISGRITVIDLWKRTPEEKNKLKFKRAFQRFMVGTSFKGQYRLLTLTTPPTFKGSIHSAWRKFIKRMRRRGLIREYYVVKEWNDKHNCQHLHVVLRLSYVDYMIARSQWKAVTGALWINVTKVYSAKGMMYYLGKYLKKGYERY